MSEITCTNKEHFEWCEKRNRLSTHRSESLVSYLLRHRTDWSPQPTLTAARRPKPSHLWSPNNDNSIQLCKLIQIGKSHVCPLEQFSICQLKHSYTSYPNSKLWPATHPYPDIYRFQRLSWPWIVCWEVVTNGALRVFVYASKDQTSWLQAEDKTRLLTVDRSKRERENTLKNKIRDKART